MHILTSSVKDRKRVMKVIENGDPSLIIGTHALIQENIKFSGDTNTYTNTDSFRFKYLIPIAMALGIGGIGYSVRKCAAHHNRNYQTCDDLESQP